MKAKSGFTILPWRVSMPLKYGITGRRLNRGASFPIPPASPIPGLPAVWATESSWNVLLCAASLALRRWLPSSPCGRDGPRWASPGVILYKFLKKVFVRERPFITHSTIDLAMAPLDRYSFPSGHTLHAVSFAWQATAHFPELGWVLVPLAALIAASRVVLGLHYPTDVLVGAALGGSLAELGLSFT